MIVSYYATSDFGLTSQTHTCNPPVERYSFCYYVNWRNVQRATQSFLTASEAIMFPFVGGEFDVNDTNLWWNILH